MRRTALATGIAVALHTATIATVVAQENEQDQQTSDSNQTDQGPVQDEQTTDVAATAGPRRAEPATAPDRMIVTGYRGSLMRAMDRKRNSIGVTDSVTAEDLADFPDQNLAESLQRIPGVSISRVANEGSEITVRGLGPEFNLVTLNGRSMPTAGNRSFDFADLATVGISAVDVHKTPISKLPSGGIGATVNVLTPRPLDRPGFRAVISGTAVHETSSSDSDTLDEVTPEFEGLYSQTFFDDKFGILISGAFQERDNREEFAEVANWRPTDRETAGPLNNPFASGNVNDNNQREDGIFFHPQNSGMGFSDLQRERINGQLVLQYAPTERFKATVDFTYSRVERETDRISAGIWFECPNIDATINENGTVTSVTQSCGDFATNVAQDHTIKENGQLGVNLQWEATESLAFNLDVHTASSRLRGGDINGRPGSSANLIIGNTSCDWCGFVDGAGPFTATIDEQTANFAGGGVPIFDVSFRSTGPDGGPQDGLLRQDIGSLFGQAFNVNNDNDLDQLQLGGEWINTQPGALESITFGYDRTEQEFDQKSAFSGILPAGFWLTSAQFWPDDVWQEGSFAGLLDEFGNGGDFPFEEFFFGDIEYLIDQFETIGADETALGCCFFTDENFWTEDFQDPSGERGFFWPGPLGNDGISTVEEDIDAFYTQLNFQDTFNGMPFNARAGLRYENADTTSIGQEVPAETIVWVGGDEFQFDFVDEPQLREGSGSSEFWLPSFAVNLEVIPDVLARASWSRSISRPPIGALGPNRDFLGNPTVGNRQVSVGNPDLQPFVSDNFDFSVEWYYAPGSFASVGFFNKLVDNFLISTTEERTFEGIRDPFRGELAEQARAELEEEGIAATNQAVFARINEIRGADPNTPIRPTENDPLAVFRVTTTSNAEEGELYGFEFAVQHLFGETGFGVQANATLVEGDIDADVNVLDQSFALPGLSDTANLVVFYENFGFSGRLAWNWRDEFLSGFDQFGAPVFTESFSPLDLNLTYDFNDNLSVFVEGLNITKDTQRSFTRFSEQLLRANQFGARWNFGARYRF